MDDKVYISKNFLSEKDKLDLLECFVHNNEFGKTDKETRHEKFYTQHTSDHDNYYKVDSRLKKLFNKFCKKKNIRRAIRNKFTSKSRRNICLSFDDKQGGLNDHTDYWSTWNFVVSIGKSSHLRIKRNGYYEINQINDGDVYLFNGDHLQHAVIISKISKQKRKTKEIMDLLGKSRICFQLRKRKDDFNY